MKRFLLILCIFITFCASIEAANMPNLKYKNIGIKDKIYFNSDTNIWSNKANKKTTTFYTKVKGFGDFFDYLDNEKNYAFSTNCEYEFIYNNKLIGYSNLDMKFYDIGFVNGVLTKNELSKDEVQEIFPDSRVVALSEFSSKTNSLKIKKHFGDLNIILLNDTNDTFENYNFTSGNAKFQQYYLRSFLKVEKQGMIQFSAQNNETPQKWYVILIR